MSSTTSWLVTGTNRGIGFNFVSQLAQRENVTVFAGVRDPSNAKELQELAQKHQNIHILKIVSANREDAKKAAELVERLSGKLDYVVANAGKADHYGAIQEAHEDIFTEHFKVNALGPLILFQELYHLLKKGETKRFIVISSLAGSVSAAPPFPNSAYQTSKAAANVITRKIAQEHRSEGFVVFPIHPGVVETDMFQIAMDKVPETANFHLITPQDSASQMLKVIDNSKPEDSDKFFNYDGTELPW